MNLNKLELDNQLMNKEETNTFLKNHIEKNKKVFVYFKLCIDHNYNMKKYLLIAVDPSIISYNKFYNVDNLGIHCSKDKVQETIEYVKKSIVNRIPKEYMKTLHNNYPNSKNQDALWIINSYFHLYLLTDEQVKEYIEELVQEKKDINDTINYLTSNLQ